MTLSLPVVRWEACLFSSLLEKGLAFFTVKVYAAAVSAGHVGCGGVSVLSHPLVVLLRADT